MSEEKLDIDSDAKRWCAKDKIECLLHKKRWDVLTDG